MHQLSLCCKLLTEDSYFTVEDDDFNSAYQLDEDWNSTLMFLYGRQYLSYLLKQEDNSLHYVSPVNLISTGMFQDTFSQILNELLHHLRGKKLYKKRRTLTILLTLPYIHDNKPQFYIACSGGPNAADDLASAFGEKKQIRNWDNSSSLW